MKRFWIPNVNKSKKELKLYVPKHMSQYVLAQKQYSPPSPNYRDICVNSLLARNHPIPKSSTACLYINAEFSALQHMLHFTPMWDTLQRYSKENPPDTLQQSMLSLLCPFLKPTLTASFWRMEYGHHNVHNTLHCQTADGGHRNRIRTVVLHWAASGLKVRIE